MRYLGIDESNHGRFPEIFVGAPSNKDKYIRKEDMEKIRHKGEQKGVIGSKEFKYIIIHREHKELFKPNGVIFVIYAELIRAYSDIEYVIADGETSTSVLEKIINGLEFVLENVPRIDSVPQADETIPIVNTADCIANRLYRYHTSQPRGTKALYLRHLITPNFREYMPIISKLF